MPARAYLGAVCLAGLATAAWAAPGLYAPGQPTSSPLLTAALAAAGVAASSLKVRVPGMNGSFSANYLVFLLAVVELGLAEAILVGLCSAAWQTLWRPVGRPTPFQAAFNLAAICLSLAASHAIYNAPMHDGPLGGRLLRLLLASATYFLANTALVSGAIAATEGRRPLEVWRGGYAWSLPYYLLSATLVGTIEWVRTNLGWEVAALAVPAVYVAFRSYKLQVDTLEREKLRAEAERRHAEEVAALHLRTIEALALAIEAKDDTTHDHLQRVQVYALEVGRELGLDELELRALEAASFLHDIGKLAVPDYIISKPGKLTPEEFEKMKIHPVVGAEILDSVGFPYPVVPIVRSHHEKWDGSGYPYGLRGEEIPIGARILSAVDCLDALASHRQYRPALPVDKAMEIVRKEAGKAFDPRVVDVIDRRYTELEAKAKSVAAPGDAPKLSKEIKITRGEAPAAGFQQASARKADTAGPPEAAVLEEISSKVASSLDPATIHQTVEAKLRLLIPFDCVAIYTRRDDTLFPAYVQGEDATLFSTLEIPIGQGLSGWVAENKKSLLNGNPAVEPGYLNDPTKFTKLRSGVAVPMVVQERSTGVIALYSAERDAFDQDHLRVLQIVGPKVAAALANAAELQAAQAQSAIDPVTGLPNAAALFARFDAEVNRSRRSGEALAVLAADLNRFRLVNGKLGQVRGDSLLRDVGASLRAICREYDLVARTGDDQFAVLLPGCDDSAARARAESLRSAVAALARERLGEDDHMLSISLGHACFPADGGDPEELLASAEKRLHATKQRSMAHDMVNLSRATAPHATDGANIGARG
jgi:diguanylate cyclase (GGDEF)-like protein/putative nucleotidyltransferase with HDIG domain